MGVGLVGGWWLGGGWEISSRWLLVLLCLSLKVVNRAINIDVQCEPVPVY